MVPTWLTAVAWTYLSICFCCAAAIAGDIFIAGRRQPMGVMNAVFPITALYFGPLALAFYWRWGRAAGGMVMAGGAVMAAPPAMTAFFEVGLFGWMAVMAFALFPAPHPLMPDSAAFWFLMQVGMMVGYATSWPANVWLVNRGIKIPM